MSTNEEKDAASAEVKKQEQLSDWDREQRLQLLDLQFAHERRKILAEHEDLQIAHSKGLRALDQLYLERLRQAELDDRASAMHHRREIAESNRQWIEQLTRCADTHERQATAWERIAATLEKMTGGGSK